MIERHDVASLLDFLALEDGSFCLKQFFFWLSLFVFDLLGEAQKMGLDIAFGLFLNGYVVSF